MLNQVVDLEKDLGSSKLSFVIAPGITEFTIDRATEERGHDDHPFFGDIHGWLSRLNEFNPSAVAFLGYENRGDLMFLCLADYLHLPVCALRWPWLP